MKEAVKQAAITKFRRLGVPRDKYLDSISGWLSRPEIIIVKSVRRSGKSTLLMQLASKLKKTVYVNFDDYRLLPYLGVELLDELVKRLSLMPSTTSLTRFRKYPDLNRG